MDNDNSNSKDKIEIPCYDNTKYAEPNNADKNKLITDLSQFPIGYIKQTKSNEFIIKNENFIFPRIFSFFGGSIFSSLYLYVFYN